MTAMRHDFPASCEIGSGGAPMSVQPWDDLSFDLAWRSLNFGRQAVRHLTDKGVPVAFVNALLMEYRIATARVTVGKSGLFEFDAGEPHLLIGVTEAGQVIDVCAVRSPTPDKWGLLTGDGWALGHEHFAAARLGTVDKLRIFATPFDWLRGAGAGLCLLDWDAAALGALRGLGPGVTLECSDARAAELLRRALTWGGLPKVTACAESVERRAA